MKQPQQPKINKHFREMALRMTLHCVRNTIIEDYHVQGKLSDADMKAFNIEVSNKIYTFLQILSNPYYETYRKYAYGHDGVLYAPSDWNSPKLDKRLMKALRIAEKRTKNLKK